MRHARLIATQAVAFAVVGTVATLAHVALALILAEGLGLAALWANFWAFCAAVLVSYLGNHKWTFAVRDGHVRRFPRFALTALLGLVLNQAIVHLTVDVSGWSYRTALALVIFVVPVASFLMNRLWVFQPLSPAGDNARGAS